MCLVLALSLLCAAGSLPDARPDCGGVSFNFARMSARRFSTPADASDPNPFKVTSHFSDTLDGIFALSENQVGELDFVFWSTNDSAVAVSFRAELPAGVELVDTTFRPGLRSSSNPWWVARHVLLAAARGPGGCGPGRLVVTCTNETGRFEVASKPIQFAILPEIRTARPRHYANGSFCGDAFGFSDRRSVERYARFLADAGVSWILPSAAESYPALDIWRRNGFRIVTPYAGGWCANGYQLGDGKVPWTDRVVAARPMEPKYWNLPRHSVCPLSVIERSDYCREVVEPTIVRHLSGGVDGLWVNWEPFMYHGRGCGCERCGQAFAKWLGRPWMEIYPSWPSCAFRGGDLAWEGRRFRSWLHGQMMRRLDACVRTATGGEKSFGLVPGLHFEQMLSGWRKSDLMAESRPVDFADSFRWVNLWGPYLPWHAHLPYEEERGRYVGPWVVAHDLRGSVDRDYPAARRPKAPGDFYTMTHVNNVNFSNFYLYFNDASKPLRGIDGSNFGSMDIRQVGVYTERYFEDRFLHEKPKTPAKGSVGVWSTPGSNDEMARIGYDCLNVGGLYIGIYCNEVDHLIMRTCTTARCCYGYWFVGGPKTLTMINCCDEGNVHLPRFRGRGHLTAIDFNVERFNAAYISDCPDCDGQKGPHGAVEDNPGSWKGFISYTLQGTAFGLGTGNWNPARFWEPGHGAGFQTVDLNK